jgi:hypothetical protein
VSKRFVAIIQDKGGQSKSWLAAHLWDWIQGQGAAPMWNLVEIEQKLEFTMSRYFGDNLATQIPLAIFNEGTQRTDPSLAPLDQLVELTKSGANILVDFGASAFSMFSVWLHERRAYTPFLKAGYEFTFLVVVCANDPEAAAFYNKNFEFVNQLSKGRVLLVKNYRDGTDFRMIDKDKVKREMPVLQAEPPLAEDFFNGERRRTLRMVMADESLAWRSHTDAEFMIEKLESEFLKNKDILLP